MTHANDGLPYGSSPFNWLYGCAAALGILAVMGFAAWWLLTPPLSYPRFVAHRVQSKNNLKQIGLAVHNYHDANKVLPQGGPWAPDEQPPLSWQTHLLPYLDQRPLFDQIDAEFPWDDTVNSNVFTVPLGVFLNPAVPGLPFVDAFAASHYAGNVQVLGNGASLTLLGIRDGTSNTVLAGEVGIGFKPWGDPTNLRDPSDGIGSGDHQFGRTDDLATQFLFCDGAVRSVSPEVDPTVLKAIATPDGGEPVSDF